MAEDEQRTQEFELREAVERISVADTLVSLLNGVASLGFYKLSAETRDLAQARLAIEALRALEPVLRERGIEEQLVRDLEQARTNLQLAYAKAVEEQNAG